mmetsp:Transcript_18105/g.20880  ORF Transcript_18105/g.20880 Transcript_18105/m.20880 type:complete len:228 (-) Transcript_18105:207-890(-)
MNFGQRGRDLVLDCQPSGGNPPSSQPSLKPYKDDTVRGCLEEITWHMDELTHLADGCNSNRSNSSEENDKPRVEIRPAFLMHDVSIRRNKRCLLAYMNFRVNAIRHQKTYPGTSSSRIPSELLSEAEIDFQQAYEQLRCNQSDVYNTVSSSGGGEDRLHTLNLSCRRMPPTQTMLQVRVLKSLGSIVLPDSSTVNLETGAVHFLPATEVEEFVQQGYLEVMEGEEAF